MPPDAFDRILVGYVATEQGTDALAVGVELAAACQADLVLASIVPSIQVERDGQQTGAPVVHRGEHGRAGAALEEAAEDLAGTPGLAKIERRLTRLGDDSAAMSSRMQ